MSVRATLAAAMSILTVTLLTLTGGACAAAWPERPIHIIVPLPAGSAADTVARLIGKKLSEKLGQPVIVDNRDGASGAIGTAKLAGSDPDGYTIGIATTTTVVTVPLLNKSIGYGPGDFTPIAMIGYSPFIMVVHPSVPAKTIQDYIALAKAKPGTLSYSSDGDASLARLSAELFANQAGIKLNQIPYKSSTQAIIDLLADRIDSQFGILTTTKRYIQSGQLRPLGVTTQKRLAEFPDIPTVAESGVPGFEVTLWIAVIAPAKLPQNIVDTLSRDINEALGQDDLKEALSNQAIFPDPQSPSALRSKIEADTAKWGPLADKAGLVQ
ncbi:MAG TPA: tripartite tricarboxylate transporter substrate binding protein [Xanthobacteraceae bacterium]|nr:tripartite tricarboxylate transporter substrate binding protein [Xanthobacteraceae bacterium]